MITFKIIIILILIFILSDYELKSFFNCFMKNKKKIKNKI